jgi:hypothetical protein
MTDTDGEQRLAEALRAKASQGAETTTPVPAELTDQLPRVPDSATAALPDPRLSGPLTTGWILALAIVLGLAAGSVIGLLTVL